MPLCCQSHSARMGWLLDQDDRTLGSRELYRCHGILDSHCKVVRDQRTTLPSYIPWGRGRQACLICCEDRRTVLGKGH